MKVTREVNRDDFIKKMDQRLRALEADVVQLKRPPTPPPDAAFAADRWWWDRVFRGLGWR